MGDTMVQDGLTPSFTGLGFEDRGDLAVALLDLAEAYGKVVYEAPGILGTLIVGHCRLRSPEQAARVIEKLGVHGLVTRPGNGGNLWFDPRLANLVTDRVRVQYREKKYPYDRLRVHRAAAVLRHIYLHRQGVSVIRADQVSIDALVHFTGVKIAKPKELAVELDYLGLHDSGLLEKHGENYAIRPKAEWQQELAERRRQREQMAARLANLDGKLPMRDHTPPPIVVPATPAWSPSSPAQRSVNWQLVFTALRDLDPELWIVILTAHPRRTQWAHNLVLLLVSQGEAVTKAAHAKLWTTVAPQPNKGFAACFESCEARGFVRKAKTDDGSHALSWIVGQLPLQWHPLISDLIEEAGERVRRQATVVEAEAPEAAAIPAAPEPPVVAVQVAPTATADPPSVVSSLTDSRWIAFLKQHPDHKKWDECDVFFFLSHRGEFLTTEAAQVMEREFGTDRMRTASLIWYAKNKGRIVAIRLGHDKRSGSRAHWDHSQMVNTWWAEKLELLLKEFETSPISSQTISGPAFAEVPVGKPVTEPEKPEKKEESPEPALASPPPPRTVAEVVAIVAAHYSLEPWELTLPDSGGSARWPRKVAMYFLYQYFDRSQRTIGNYFSRRPQPVVSFNIKNVRVALDTNQKFKEDIAKLMEKLGIKE